MVRNSLRAVYGPEAEQQTILEAAESGSRLDELRAMRRRLAKALDDPDTHPRDLSPLARRQFEISKEIEAITGASEDSPGSITAKADDDHGGWDQQAI